MAEELRVSRPMVTKWRNRTHASWLNLVERWFTELTNKWLRRSAHRSVAELRAAIEHWLATWNENPRPFIWTKTVDHILETIASY